MFILNYYYINLDDEDFGGQSKFFNTKEEALKESLSLLSQDLQYSSPPNDSTEPIIEKSQKWIDEFFDKESGEWEIGFEYTNTPSKVEITENNEIQLIS